MEMLANLFSHSLTFLLGAVTFWLFFYRLREGKQKKYHATPGDASSPNPSNPQEGSRTGSEERSEKKGVRPAPLALRQAQMRRGSELIPPALNDFQPRNPHNVNVNLNLNEVDAWFGLDMGGTLSKAVFFENGTNKRSASVSDFVKSSLRYGKTGIRDTELEVKSDKIGGTLHFIKFESTRMPQFWVIAKEQKLLQGLTRLPATGGGSFKFQVSKSKVIPWEVGCIVVISDFVCPQQGQFKERFGIKLDKKDELECLILGIDYMRKVCTDECYYLSEFDIKRPLEVAPYPCEVNYPYLVVNIGSGVSILKVDGPDSFERVGGTSLGGGTFYGMCRALTGCKTFDEALELASRGHGRNVDLLVKDIYGSDTRYRPYGLHGDHVAANFGKLVRGSVADAAKEDYAKAALIMITNNIGNIANLFAHKLLKVPTVMFVGNFLCNNPIALRTLAHATHFWSKGNSKAIFLRHEGYFGAIGSILSQHVIPDPAEAPAGLASKKQGEENPGLYIFS